MVTRDVNRELNEYKDRMAWELSNFKEQLETQSHIEVECTKQNLKSEFNHQLRNQTLTQMETINALGHQINCLGMQLQQQQVAGCPLFPQAPPIPEVTVLSQAPLHYYNWLVSQPNDNLVEVMDILNRSMTNQYAVLQEMLRQSQSASKEHYLSNAQFCDGKDPQVFGRWLDKVSCLATVCNKEPNGSGTSYFQRELT